MNCTGFSGNHVCIFIELFIFFLCSIFMSIIILCLPFVANKRVHNKLLLYV